MFLGVDGCRQGWLCVTAYGPEQFAWQIRPALDLAELKRLGVLRLAIDIPIGLPDGAEGRICDRVARQLLPGAGSRVFPAPLRAVIERWPLSYAEANQISREQSGKGISHQTLNIAAKIAQIDQQHQALPEASDFIYEAHPEVLFALLNDGQPLPSKKTAQGQQRRLALLSSPALVSLYQEVLRLTPRQQVQRDDILDACVCTLAALTGDLVGICPSEIDSRGVPIRICAPRTWLASIRKTADENK